MENKKMNEKPSLLRQAEKVRIEAERQEQHGKVAKGHKVPKAPKPPRAPRHHSVISGILTRLIIILFLLTVLLGCGYYVFTKKATPTVEKSYVLVMDQLSLCQELTTLKYRYSDVVSIKKSLGLSKSYSIIKYQGIIRVGIEDLSECDFEIYNEGKALRIKLPDVVVLGNDITEQEVFDESHSIFIPITLDEVFNEIMHSKESTLEDMIADGLLTDARENAKKTIQQMMLAAGFEEVIVN